MIVVLHDIAVVVIAVQPVFGLPVHHRAEHLEAPRAEPFPNRVEAGLAWVLRRRQVMAELAYERSGPERYLSCYPLLAELIREIGSPGDLREEVAVGRSVAHLATLRAMSMSVAGVLEAGGDPSLEAAVVKDLGGIFEQDLPGVAQSLVGREARADAHANDYQRVLAHLVQNAPSFSLRGGAREILRGIIARGLGLR